ncbi:Mis12 protein-domain-containing protein [Auriculariales sp. MPI-PUGE-AT-0066]|nr:Mis12 protein-domain-containing protein [Auriculariales sp. MPI-PUGE-AT-0066]
MTSHLQPGRLVTEILGFPPEALISDMVNGIHESVHPALEAVHAELRTWSEERESTNNAQRDEDLRLEIEEGLIAFQTLLESQNDTVADTFEAYSLRNIFTVERGKVAGTEDPRVMRQVVVPHYEGLDLDITGREENELWVELDELMRKIKTHQRLRSLLRKGERAVAAEARRSQRRAEKYNFLQYLVEDPELEQLPDRVNELLGIVAPLNANEPALDELLAASSEVAAMPPVAPAGPRSWAASKAGYVHWAVKRVLQVRRHLVMRAGCEN